MSEEEKELVRDCKLWVTEEDINYTRWFGLDDLSVLVNLIEKQQKEIENSVSKDKIREKMKEYYEKAHPYDCDTADYAQSQDIGSWHALSKLLNEE